MGERHSILAISLLLAAPVVHRAAAVDQDASPAVVSKLHASDGEAEDNFGAKIAMSGDFAVVAASGDDDLGNQSGSAYIFHRSRFDAAVWDQVAKLHGDDGDTEGDTFGSSVAVSGATVVVGADQDDHFATNSGAALVFQGEPLDPNEWTLLVKLTGSDTGTFDGFGRSAALDGSTLVVGSYRHDELGRIFGAAYIFERDPLDLAVWTEVMKLTLDGLAEASFGRSVAVSGDTLAIGDPGDQFGTYAGAVYVYQRDQNDPAVWGQVAKLTASDAVAGDDFGHVVAMQGDLLVASAPRDHDLTTDPGSAYVFERDSLDPVRWNQIAKLTAADGGEEDHFGESLAMSGDRIVVGAEEDDDRGIFSGSAYLFQRDLTKRSDWRQVSKLTAPDGEEYDQCGQGVALSGEVAIVGAYLDDDNGQNSGSAYVYAPLVCKLELAVESRVLRAGEKLRVAVDLHHRRPIAVTVPFLLWVEDAAGRVIVEKSSRPVTMEPGDHGQVRLAVNLPPSMPPGAYRVVVGVQGMQQGIAWASKGFHVLE